MKQHPNIDDLERLALYRHTLRPDEVLALAEHVRGCSFCRDTMQEIDDLSRTMDGLSDERIAQETQRILRQAISEPRGNVILLHVQPETADSGPAPFALAAKGEEAQVSFHPVATLYSDDGRTLLRILHERERESYFFQLMSEFMDRVPHALLSAPGRIPMMTDVDGAHRVADTEIDIVQIASMSVFYALDRLRTGPVTTNELGTHDGVVLASDDSTLQLRAEGDVMRVRMRWHGAEDATPRYVGITSKDGQAVGAFENGEALLPLRSIPDDGVLLMY
ncbi:MAG: hypothetical protein KFF77_05685 [Bacteroidetes bacterium]|nr:hypothetical protein [Bacteroidota bacterium]